MAEHCKDNLMVEGLLTPKTMQPRHPLTVPKMDTIAQEEVMVHRKYTCTKYMSTMGWVLWELPLYRLSFIQSLPCFLHGSNSHCTDERTETKRKMTFSG